VYGFDIPHLRYELRDAVKRVRRKPCLIRSGFHGAKRLIVIHGSVSGSTTAPP
jgi:hypothetical protein